MTSRPQGPFSGDLERTLGTRLFFLDFSTNLSAPFLLEFFFPLFAAIYFFPVPSLNFLRLFSSQIREKIGKHQEKKDEKDSIKTFSEVFRDIFQDYFDYFLSFLLFFSNCRSTVFGQFNEYFPTFSSIFRTFSQFSSFSPNSQCLFFSIFFSFF